jgi:hypothetical protein
MNSIFIPKCKCKRGLAITRGRCRICQDEQVDQIARRRAYLDGLKAKLLSEAAAQKEQNPQLESAWEISLMPATASQ